MAFEEFGQLSKRRREERAQKTRKKILLVIFLVVFILGLLAGGIYAVVHFAKKTKAFKEKSGSSSSGDQAKTSTKIIQMLCNPTDYKRQCQDTLTHVVQTNTTKPAIAPKLIIRAAVSAAAGEVDKAIKKTGAFNFDNPDDKAAYEVCKKLFEDSVDELAVALSHTGEDVKDFRYRLPNLRTWLSAVYSYQETCIDAFTNEDTKTKLKHALNATQEYVGNSLALVSQISFFFDRFGRPANGGKPAARHLLGNHQRASSEWPSVDNDGFPEWIGHEERKLLVKSTSNLVANLTVAKDGSGNFTSITECLKSLPEDRKERIYIFVKEGTYEEYVTVTKKMVNVTMYGDGSQKSIITGNKNFVDGVRTFETATFAVVGEGFVAIGLGFKNTAGPEKHQAVALRVQADHSIFLNCRMEGYQDTLYAQTHRQFYRSCYISGTVDFIFGDAAAVFQNCLIMVRQPMDNQQNIVTAQGRADRHENSGFVLHNCRIHPDKDLESVKQRFKTYLGRPWKEFSRTIVMESTIEDIIEPEGWLPWQGQFALKTLLYAEYNNHGPGADVSNRVKWPGYKKHMSRQEAQSYTVTPFLQGITWIQNNPNVLVHLGLYN